MPSVKNAAPQFLVDDLNASLSFYEKKLGFAVDFVYDDFYASVSRDGASIHLKHADKISEDRVHRQTKGHLDAYLDVSDVRELDEEFRGRGVAISKPLEERPWSTLDFYLEDPDGYVLCFAEGL